MSRRVSQAAFGATVGILTRFLLPGHHSIGVMATVLLSLAGALGGELVAERFLPGRDAQPAGFATSAIGALAVLLAYGLAS